MAEVLRASPTPDSQPLYQSSGLRRSQPSSSSLVCLDSAALSPSPRSTTPSTPHAEHTEHLETSPSAATLAPSKASSSDLTSFANLGLERTNSSTGWSMDSNDTSSQDDEPPDFPDYMGLQFAQMPSTPHIDFEGYGQSSSDEPVSESVTTDTTRSDSPLPTPTVLDDTAMKLEPKQHVDYLSHDWREEDIWSSWRHIVSQRRVYGQRSRLENASWRTWAKSKYQLRTVSPETLNWLKESDVTWLYGPLKPAESHPVTSESNRSAPDSRLSKNSSFCCTKKPILKKRSMSEVMLQKSLSTSSLVQQAAAAVQAQRGRPMLRGQQRIPTAELFGTSSSLNQSETPSRDPTTDYFTSKSTSQTTTPSAACECKQERHIRFDDKVEQCIAVECKDGDAESDDEEEAANHHEFGNTSDSESDSDEGFLTMKKKRRPGLVRRKSSKDGSKRSQSQPGRKMVETLPSTTLKFKDDNSADIPRSQSHHTFGFRNWNLSGALKNPLLQLQQIEGGALPPNISPPSPSQETLRPARPSRNYLIPDDDEDETASEFDAGGSQWTFGASNSKSSLGSASSSEDDVSDTPSRWRRRDSVAVHKTRARNGTPAPPKRTNSEEEVEGRQQAELGGGTADSATKDFTFGGELRRTGSGMMMPYDEEDEDELMAVGLFGRVSETINTARDIAHVIWNVGWRNNEG
ncbi:hypothetical protein BTJ68_13295 [Hortaea werneckii EXF-2000]|uniref:Nitrogen regulatory protein areA GATA-like domain-containing protein n=1 Tax=Hortaea werneckii EXF-2000 TaxID=1157616 RepID=A0A1Z5STN9_HORWE|nr:hypothetical protein BTJ68_13295 [Hortaea werneckii EXF-2000]